MPEYKNKPEGFAEQRKQLIKKLIPICLLSGTGGLAIFYFTQDRPATDMLTWVIIAVFLIGLFFFTGYRVIKRQKELYNSYRLTLSGDRLLRQQTGLPPLTLYFTDINQLTKDKYNNLVVKGPKASGNIFISAYIENYSTITTTLEAVQPISELQNKTFIQKYPFVPAILAVGTMIAFYISNNKIIVSVSGIMLLILMGWGFYEIQTTPQVDAKVKRSSWWMLVVAVSLIAIIHYKVFAV